MKTQFWQNILQIAITVLTAIATTFGVTSCMWLLITFFGQASSYFLAFILTNLVKNLTLQARKKQ